jgi:hypothetical protein
MGGSGGMSCQDDANEPDDIDAATPIAEATPINGRICTGDSDWFSFSSNSSCTAQITLTFTHANGDLDLYLYDENEDILDDSESIDDNEVIEEPITAGDQFIIEVYGFDDASNSYTVRWECLDG